MKNVKNMFKQIFSVCLSIVILLTVCIMPVNAEDAPSSFTVKRTKVMESYIGDNNGFTAFATTDGVIVYCMDLAKKGATTGTKYTLSKEASNGLRYIIQNGYPNKKITNRDEIDQYITQAAVWWYLDETSGAGNLSKAFKTTDKEAYDGIRDQIIKLVNDAKKAGEITKPSMSTSIASKNLKLTSDKKYYESDYVTVILQEASSYKVELSNSSASVVDENGNVKTTFNTGEKFKVRLLAKEVTEAASLNVKISSIGSVEYAVVFNPSDNVYQRVVSSKLYTKEVNLSDTLTVNVTPEKKICTIENGKYYGNDGKEVDKKTYNKECGKVCIIENGKYYGNDGKEVDKKTYNKECGKICTIDNDKYYGKDGNEVTKDIYNKECGKVCTIENDKYYGKNGTEVDENTYNKECTSVVITVPSTLANQSIMMLVIGMLCIASGLGLIAYRYKFYKN